MLCRTMALRRCLGKAKPAKCTSERGWNTFSAICAQPTQICRQDQLGWHHHTPHSQGLRLPPECSGPTADSDSTTEVLQCGWSWTESSQEAGFCLNLWLCDNIHHTLMVQWQKDPTQTLHNCTHNTYMYIIHTQTNTYICIHTCMDSTQYSSWQKGSKIYPQYYQWWYLNWLLFQDTVTRKDLYTYHWACPCN